MVKTGKKKQLVSPAKIECMRCKERKDPRFFVSPWEAIREWVDSHSYLTPPNDNSQPTQIVLCAACLRILAKKSNQRWQNQKPKYRLCGNIKTGIYKSLRTGRGGQWEKRVGYTIAELKEHLQKQFEPGMSWSNYGPADGQWQIDHIKTVASFDFSKYDDEDFKRCWSLSNLRPLWARDNWKRKKNQQPMRRCFDESPYTFCMDCPQAIQIKYRGRFCLCKDFFQKFYCLEVPVGYSLPDLKWWETSSERLKAMMAGALLGSISALQRKVRLKKKLQLVLAARKNKAARHSQ